MNKRRVVITGVGAITPVGITLETTWDAMLAGRNGISHITCFNAEGIACRIGGQIKDFDPTVYQSKQEARKMDRFMQLGFAAGVQAFVDSGLEVTEENAPSIGVYIGSGIGGVSSIEKTMEDLLEKKITRVSPFYIPKTIINMVAGNLSIKYGLKGPNLSLVSACSTGTHSIGEAGRLIEYGDADVMIAGGAEAALTRTSVAGFSAARALSFRNDDPTTASRPWDIGRDGFVMGEGAGVMVLEEYQHAHARGAKIYAELLGFGMSGDAHHITAPPPDGEGASRCMRSALRNASISPDQVDYVNAHGTSTPLGDAVECKAIRSTFGSHAERLAISSNKSMIGHLLGAAGGVEAVMTVLSVYRNAIPPTINLVEPDPQCDLDFVPGEARDLQVQVAISNSFGFGGTNGTLVFSAV